MMEHTWHILSLVPEESFMCLACGFISDDKLQKNCRGKRLANEDYIKVANDPEDLYD